MYRIIRHLGDLRVYRYDGRPWFAATEIGWMLGVGTSRVEALATRKRVERDRLVRRRPIRVCLVDGACLMAAWTRYARCPASDCREYLAALEARMHRDA